MQTLGDLGDFVVGEILVEQSLAQLGQIVVGVGFLNQIRVFQVFQSAVEGRFWNIDVVKLSQDPSDGASPFWEGGLSEDFQNGPVGLLHSKHRAHVARQLRGSSFNPPENQNFRSERCLKRSNLLLDGYFLLPILRAFTPKSISVGDIIREVTIAASCRSQKSCDDRAKDADAAMGYRPMNEHAPNQLKATDCFGQKDNITTRIRTEVA